MNQVCDSEGEVLTWPDTAVQNIEVVLVDQAVHLLWALGTRHHLQVALLGRSQLGVLEEDTGEATLAPFYKDSCGFTGTATFLLVLVSFTGTSEFSVVRVSFTGTVSMCQSW